MIEKLRARGFKGIKRGIDLDEIEIDFTGKGGLIALDGANGRGKTSVLDLLHPFDCLASRDGSLYTHCFLRNSEKELAFTYGGKHYRTLIKIDSESGRSEGYAWIDHSEASVVKGKISEYHKWAIQEFGSPELFFASIFCAQNSKKISDMTVGTLKSLFVEFLRLERYEAWADTSKQAANIIEGKMGQIDSRIAALKESAEKKDALKFDLDGYRVSLLPTWEDEKNRLQREIIDKRLVVDSLKATIQANVLAIQRKSDLQGQFDRLERELSESRKIAEAEIKVLGEKWTGIKKEITATDATLKDKTRIEGAAAEETATTAHLETIQVEADRLTGEIGTAKEKVHGLETTLAGLRQQVKDLDNDPENIRLGKLVEQAERDVKEKERELAALDDNRELFNVNAQMENAKAMTKALDVKDPSCESTTCSFIVRAIKAADDMIPLGNRRAELLEEIETKRVNLTSEIADIKECTSKVLDDKASRLKIIAGERMALLERIKQTDHDLRNAQQVVTGDGELLATCRQDILRDRDSLAKIKVLAARSPEIAVAEHRKADLEKQLAEVTAQGSEKKQAWIDRENAFKAEMIVVRDKIDATVIDFQSELSLSQTHKDITEIEAVKIPAVEKEIQDAREKIATLQAELSRIEAAEKELVEVKEQRDALAVQVSRWRYLQQACGKNGLQALEIDGAAPLISSRANELLYMGYGPQYSIRIDTQDEEGREDMDIKVLSEWGEDSLKQKSGGEKIWLLHPIRLAMTLLSKEKSGREFDAIFFDEIDGPLDAKGAALNFMEMYRPFMDIGKFKQLFFITHRDECLSYADHVLKFEKGKCPYWG